MAALTPSKLPKMLKVIDIDIEIMGVVNFFFFATVYLPWFLDRSLPLGNTYLPVSRFLHNRLTPPGYADLRQPLSAHGPLLC